MRTGKLGTSKDGLKQPALDEYFLTSTKTPKSVTKLVVKKERSSKSKKKLFKAEIITIEDKVEESFKEVIKEEQDALEKSTLLWKRTDICVASTSRDTETFDEHTNVISLNKPIKQTGSPEKLKPRVLQTNLSQNSTNSDDTIIYDPFEDSESNSTRLIQKVNENVQATKSSSISYRISDIVSQQATETPTKKSRKFVHTEENEIFNPRAVNFVTKIIKYIFSQPHFECLFNEEEVATLERFYSLPHPEYNFLCYKLYTRLPRWYNIFKLCENIGMCMNQNEILNMQSCLASNGFVYTDYSSEPLQLLLNLLNATDIKQICDSFKLKIKSGSKSQKIENLLNNCSKQTTLTLSKNINQILRDRVSEKLGRCVKLSEKLYDLLYRIHLLYALGSSDFSKPHQLYQFMESIQNGNTILPGYTVDTASLFDSRDEFLAFAKASEYRDELFNAVDTKNKDVMLEISRVAYKKLQDILNQKVKLKPSYLLRFTAGATYVSALSTAAKHLCATCREEVKKWLQLLLSQKTYGRHKRGIWYDQLAMIETKYAKNYEMGIQVIINALQDKTISEVAMHDLSLRGLAMKNSKTYNISEFYVEKLSTLLVEPPNLDPFPSIVIEAKAIRGNESGRKRTYIETSSATEQYLTSVEQVALNYYKRNGFTKGFHCEGSLLITIFFILFWDIIYYTKVPSAFINEIQYIPLDLFSEEFYTNRKNDLDKRLMEIKSDWSSQTLNLFIKQNWENHAHKRSLIVSDLLGSSDELIQIVRCIGRECLTTVMERLVKDFKLFHSGLPDLFVWNVAEQKCRFVEVKGEKDKLSMKQRLWLNYLRMAKADIQVCHVHSIGSKRPSKIAKLRESQSN